MIGAGGAARPLTALNGLCACLIVCAIGLYASQAAGPFHSGVLIAAAFYQRWRWAGRGGEPSARRRMWEGAAFVTLLFFIGDLFIVSRNLIGAALRLLAFIVAYHADNPQNPRGARQTLGLTFVQMIAAAASTTEVSFSILMAAYLLAALYTLAALGAAEREDADSPLPPHAPSPAVRAPLARLTLTASPAVVMCGLAVFFCVPHYGTGYFHEAGRSLRRNISGFSERIELGSIGSIKKSHATVMRVRLADPADAGGVPPLPLRMRGIALDHYDGRTWSVSDPRRKWLRPDESGAYPIAPDLLPADAGRGATPAGSPRDRRRQRRWLSLEILLEPLDTRVIFTPPQTFSLTLTRFYSVGVDRQGSVFTGGSAARRFPYRTLSAIGRPRRAIEPGDEPPDGIGAYLQLPPLDPRIDSLAQDLVRGLASPAERARAIEKRLREEYRYSLDVNDGAVQSPLTHFLIERNPGHCEYFATAMAILLRARGIPARVVDGFYGGEHSDLVDQTIIRQSDAHAWVEAWIPGEGWVTFDPTPADPEALQAWSLFARMQRWVEETEIAWDTYIVGLDLDDQQNALQEIRDRVDLTLAGIVIRLHGVAHFIDRIAGGPGRGVAFAIVISLILAAGIAAAFVARAGWRAWRRNRSGAPQPHPASDLFARFEKICARRGLTREPHVTASEFARGAGAPEVAIAFEAARYGPASRRAEWLDRLRREITDQGRRPERRA